MQVKAGPNFLHESEGKKYPLKKRRYKDRHLVNVALKFQEKATHESSWTGDLKRRANLLKKMVKEPIMKDFAPPYCDLSEARNNINHGGFTEKNKKIPKDFERKLMASYKAILGQLHKYL